MGGSDPEVQSLKDDVKEIKGDVKNVHTAITELRVLIASNYVTRTEFDKHKEEQKTILWRWATFIITATGVFATLLLNIFWRK